MTNALDSLPKPTFAMGYYVMRGEYRAPDFVAVAGVFETAHEAYETRLEMLLQNRDDNLSCYCRDKNGSFRRTA